MKTTRKGASFPENWVAPAALAVLAFVPFLPGLSGDGIYVFRDHLANFLPKRFLLAQALQGQASVLWDPFVALGSPFLPDPQAGFFYPPILLLFGLLPFRLAYQVYPALHVVLAGLAFYLLMRQIGLSRRSAFFGGLVFQWSGFVFSLIDLLNILASLAWIPLALVAVHWAASRPSRATLGSVAAGVFLTLSFLAGEPQAALFGAFATAAFGLYRSLETGAGWRSACRRVLVTAVVAAGLSMVQALPMWLWVQETRRADGMEVSQLVSTSLHPIELWDLVAPSAFQDGDGAKWSGAQGFISTLYLGWMTIFALTFFRLRKEAATVFPIAMAVLGLLLAFGAYLPGYAWLHTHLGLSYFRYPVRFLFLFFLGIAWLAAQGFEEIQKVDRKRASLTFFLPLLAAISLLALLMVLPFRFPSAVSRSLVAGLLRGVAITAIAGGLLELANRSTISQRVAAALLLLLAISDLALVPRSGLETRPYELVVETPAAFGDLETSPDRPPPRLFSTIGAAAAQSLAAGEGITPIDATRRLLALLPSRVSTLYGIAEVSRDGVYPARGYEPLLGALSSGRHPPLESWLGLSRRLDLRKRDGRELPQWQKIDANPSPLRLAEPIAGGSIESTIATLRDRRSGLRERMPIPSETFESLDAGDTASCARRGRVELLGWRPHDIRARVELACPALVVHTATLLPGWSASVDDEPAELVPALGILQALGVPAGVHEVRFNYWPAGLTAGLWISGLTLLALLLGFAFRLFVRGGRGVAAD